MWNTATIQFQPKLFYTSWIDSWGKVIVSLDNFYILQIVTEKMDTYGTVNKTTKDLPVNFSKEKVPKGEIVRKGESKR